MSSYLEQALRQAREEQAASAPPAPGGRFVPRPPRDLLDAGLDAGRVDGLVLKVLLGRPGLTGIQISRILCLPSALVRDRLAVLKLEKKVVHRAATATGDFHYELSASGREAALQLRRVARYAGAAPVSLEHWLESLRMQSVHAARPTRDRLEAAFSDLVVPFGLMDRLGPAVGAGRGLFLHGDPGNGKTSLAERITRSYGDAIYIPRTVEAFGWLVQVFDPAVHEPVPPDERPPIRTDERWVLCRRPTVVVGGELTLDQLELSFSEHGGVCGAPAHVKASGGVLVVDDFGRQRVEPTALLNRWIVPMEKAIDFLTLPDGRKLEVPFEAFLVFATNLRPKDLVDEAFLRRIPYKVRVEDPDGDQFRRLFELQAAALGLTLAPGLVEHVVQRWYAERSFRFCHPRDLLTQVAERCAWRDEPPTVTPALIDAACVGYFLGT